MQLLIIVPRQPSTTGNHVTAQRFAALLPAHNWNCRIVETAADSAREIDQATVENFPDAILLLHAHHSGRPWLSSEQARGIPTLLLMTGTDYNQDLYIPERAAVIAKVHQQVAGVIIQNQLLRLRLSQQIPSISDKLHLLPPGIRIGNETHPLREKLALVSSTPLFLCPAGIRPVKGNLELLLMCDQLVEQQPNFNLAFCGPPLDDDYTASFFDTLDERPWAHYLGEIPKMAMADAMRQADVIVNNSRSEGVSNALVEAVSLGRPILATDIIGNRAIVQHGKNGLLYYGQEQFQKQATQLIRDLKLRRQLSKPNPSAYSAEREGKLLAAILNKLVTPQ
jgi:glycosyltransferase involved in cell wall biosynthesis